MRGGGQWGEIKTTKDFLKRYMKNLKTTNTYTYIDTTTICIYMYVYIYVQPKSLPEPPSSLFKPYPS